MMRLSDSDAESLNPATSHFSQPKFNQTPSSNQPRPDVHNGAPLHNERMSPAAASDVSNELALDQDAKDNLRQAPSQKFLAVLKNYNFLTLWSGQVFSQLADKVYLVLMIALITTRFQTAGQTVSGWVSSIMVAFTIPAVLFGSLAGVFVDHWSKKQVLVITNLLRGGLVLALPPLLWLFQDWGGVLGIPSGFCVLLGVTFLVSTLTQFFAPAEQAIIPLIIERHYLLSANSLYTLTMMISVIVGFAVGEPLLAIADTLSVQLWGSFEWGKELVVGGSYAIAGLLLLWLKTGEKINNAASSSPQVWQDIQDGLQYLKRQNQVLSALIQLVILFSVFAALAVLVVRQAEIMPEIKASQFGFLLAAGGVGTGLGAVAVGQLSQYLSHRQLGLCGSIGVATSLTGLSLFNQQLWPTLILLGSMGVFGALVGVPMQTTIQERTPEEIRGKIFGLQNNAVNIALSLPLALAGVAETLVGLRIVFLGLAAIVVTGGLFTWYISGTGSSETDDINLLTPQ